MRSVIAGFVIAVLALASHAQIVPPAGPVADSFKDLDQVEPRIPLSQETTPGDLGYLFTISESGSYYLTENLVLPTESFLEIDASGGDVTVDLMGHTVHVQYFAADIINANGAVNSVTIRNGTLIGGADGIDAGAEHLVLEDLQIRDTSGYGIDTNARLRVRDTTLRDIGGTGVRQSSSAAAILERVSVLGTAGRGIVLSNNSIVRDCVVNNTESTALEAGSGSTIEGVAVSVFLKNGSATPGVELGAGSSIVGSTIRDYQGTDSALKLGADCLASGVTLTDAPGGIGVYLGADSMLEHSVIRDTGTAGVFALGSNTIKNNSIRRASGGTWSLDAGDGCVIEQNRFYGSIRYNTSNVVVRNSLRTGSYQTTGVSNTVGPINDINNPWSNFDK